VFHLENASPLLPCMKVFYFNTEQECFLLRFYMAAFPDVVFFVLQFPNSQFKKVPILLPSRRIPAFLFSRPLGHRFVIGRCVLLPPLVGPLLFSSKYVINHLVLLITSFFFPTFSRFLCSMP